MALLFPSDGGLHNFLSPYMKVENSFPCVYFLAPLCPRERFVAGARESIRNESIIPVALRCTGALGVS